MCVKAAVFPSSRCLWSHSSSSSSSQNKLRNNNKIDCARVSCEMLCFSRLHTMLLGRFYQCLMCNTCTMCVTRRRYIPSFEINALFTCCCLRARAFASVCHLYKWLSGCRAWALNTPRYTWCIQSSDKWADKDQTGFLGTGCSRRADKECKLFSIFPGFSCGRVFCSCFWNFSLRKRKKRMLISSCSACTLQQTHQQYQLKRTISTAFE